MEILYQLSIALTTWMQQTLPQLHGFMAAISGMGEEQFFLIALPLLYWTIDKRLGRLLGYFFLLSVLINSNLKAILRGPRPYWLDPSIKQGEVGGYGVPSGHTQHATVVFLLAAAYLKRTWVWIVVLLYVFTMAISRIYLGVHFIHDTVVGFTVGVILLLAFALWQAKLRNRFDRQILGRRMLLIILIPLVMAAVYVVTMLIIGPPNMNVPWASFIPEAEIDGYESVVTAVASLLGFGIGVTMESSRVRFRADGPIWKRIVRFLLGIIVAVGIWAGLRAIFPAEPLILALPLRFIRYLLLLLWVSYFAPWLFVRLKLASIDPQPEIQVTFP